MNGLSIIIVYFNTPDHLDKCLASIFKYTYAFSCEVIVLDNSSDLPTREIVIKKYPNIRWIDMGYNAGFARANNRGLEEAVGDVILLLNSDTIIIEDAINFCYTKFISSPHVAAGVQLINNDGSPQITGNFFTIGGLNSLLALPFFGKVLKWVALMVGVKKTHQLDITDEKIVDWINGAFIMVKRSAIQQVGRMDPDFFLFSEEIEWCSRLRKIGTLCVYGQCHVIHAQGESTSVILGLHRKGYAHLDNKMGLQLMLSSLLRIRKQYGVGWYWFHMFIYTLETPFFWVGSLLAFILGRGSLSYFLSSALQYTHNVLRLWLFSPAIVFRKNKLFKVI